MLDYIKTNVSNQCDLNEANAKTIRELLKDYEAKLKDLEDALKEATALVKEANTQNGLSAESLKELLVMIRHKNSSVIKHREIPTHPSLITACCLFHFSLQKRIEGLKKEQKTVLDQIDMAENELQKTGDMAKILTDSKMVNPMTERMLSILFV